MALADAPIPAIDDRETAGARLQSRRVTTL